MIWEDPPSCNSGIREDPIIIRIIPYNHYYKVGGVLLTYNL